MLGNYHFPMGDIYYCSEEQIKECTERSGQKAGKGAVPLNGTAPFLPSGDLN